VSTEEDTYKRLKGLTFEEAKVVANQIFDVYYRSTNWNRIKTEINKGLAPYGWSYERLEYEVDGSVNIQENIND